MSSESQQAVDEHFLGVLARACKEASTVHQVPQGGSKLRRAGGLMRGESGGSPQGHDVY